jgi:hypothetical protein
MIEIITPSKPSRHLSKGGCISESNTDRYLAARERHNAAQAQKRALAQQLRQLAAKLEDPGGIRINERSIGKISRGFAHILDQSEWVAWDRAVDVIRNAVSAEDDYMLADSNLTRQERDQLGLR